MVLNEGWFSEVDEAGGSAFSLKLKDKVHEEQTPFQRIEIYETEGFGTLMVIDGFVMLTDRDNFIYHEMMTHPALYAHPGAKRVVVVGGGDCGSLREVLKHPHLERVTQVEIDERVTRLAETYFPDLCESNGDPRAEFLFTDGIAWMGEVEADSVDVIIVDSTDPIGPAEGLFGEPFYRACLRALGRDGILVQQSESPLYHLDLLRAMRKAMGAAGFKCLATLQFPQCSYPSGWWSATMACKGDSMDGFCEAGARTRAFQTRYYNPEIHRAALVLPEFLRAALDADA